MKTRTLLLLAAVFLTAFHAQAFANNMPSCKLKQNAAATDAEMNVANWEKSRALYMHDMRLANMEQKPEVIPEATVEIADTLSDAGLYVAYAETDGVVLNNPKKAQSDLDQARNLLNQASAMADQGNKASIDKVEKSLKSAEKMITACNGTNSDEQRQAFEKLRKSIGQLVGKLG